MIKSDRYDVLVTTSSSSIEAELSLQVQNNRLLDRISVPATGQYGIWKEHNIGQIDLEKGTATLTFIINKGGANLKSFNLSSNSSRNGEVILSHKIYPNPVNDYINFQFESLLSKQVSVSIFNLIGQQVWNNDFSVKAGDNAIKFNLIESKEYNFSNGIYFVVIEDGKKSIKEKFTFIR